MKGNCSLFTFLFSLLVLVSCRTGLTNSGSNVSTSVRYAEMQTSLMNYTQGKDARIGIAVIIDGKDTVSINGNRDFPMMSVFKFPLSLIVANRVDASNSTLNDSIFIKAHQLKENTWSPMLSKYGMRDMGMTLLELLDWTLTQSDNNATDILLEYVGGTEKMSGLMKDMDFPCEITVGASEADMMRDHYMSYLNLSTPVAMAKLFELFRTGLNHQSDTYRAIESLLIKCNTGGERLSAGLPGTGITIAYKTGTGFETPDGRLSALNDCGYVILPDGRTYSIAVFIADSAYDMDQTSKLIADISAIVYRTLNPELRTTTA